MVAFAADTDRARVVGSAARLRTARYTAAAACSTSMY
jgi:hypothetical protein